MKARKGINPNFNLYLKPVLGGVVSMATWGVVKISGSKL